MSDRIPSDHPTFVTIDATLDRLGATGRPCVAVPGGSEDAPATDGVIRLVLDGRVRHAHPIETGEGALSIRGVYDTPALARDPSGGTNRLASWVEIRGLEFGRTVHLDVVVPGFQYGLRAPGERIVYDVPDRPDSSLAAIADRLDDG